MGDEASHPIEALLTYGGGPSGEHPSGDVHRRKLLEQELGCIGDVHLRDPRLVLARTTLERVLLEVSARRYLSEECLDEGRKEYLKKTHLKLTRQES